MTFVDAGNGAWRRMWHGSRAPGDSGGVEAARRILDAADERDAVAEARDAAADERERELDLVEMLDVATTYGTHWTERREAALDRWYARVDRAAARADRMALARALADRDD
jgi:hypothetical protein